MIDREKVIKGLEHCLADEWQTCTGCPYNSGYTYDDPHSGCQGSEEPMRDALALLKAREPRVLTLEDVLKLRFNDVVYFEMAISSVAIPAIVIDVIEHMPDGEIGLLQLRHIQQPTNNADLEYYGKTWRCWTSRPMKEEMEGTPWN